MNLLLRVVLIVVLFIPAAAQTLPFLTDQQYKYLVGEISGDAACEHLRFTTQFHKPDGGVVTAEMVGAYLLNLESAELVRLQKK